MHANTRNSFNVRDIQKTYNSAYAWNRDEPIVHIGAYCLMPNHFHILVTPLAENGIVQFMLKLSTGYSMYFNKRNERTGTLFQGRFKSKRTQTDEYLKYLFSYIHLNPVKLIQHDWKEVGIRDKEKTKEYLNTYTYSSLLDYFGVVRDENKILNSEKFPQYFNNRTEVDTELFDWLTYREYE